MAYSAVRKLPVHTKPQCYGTLAQAASVVEWAAKQAFDSIRQSLGLDRLLVLVGRQARSRISRMCVCVCVRNQREGGISMVISLDMIDMHVISDCVRKIFSEMPWHMDDMHVMAAVS